VVFIETTEDTFVRDVEDYVYEAARAALDVGWEDLDDVETSDD